MYVVNRKNQSWHNLVLHSAICLEGTKKAHKRLRIGAAWTENQTGYSPNIR